MLYNVLPPLIFFTALGGIILIVSRVVLRIRREQVTANIQHQVTAIGQKRTRTLKDIAKLIGPSRNSVHFLKNRAALFISVVADTVKNSQQEFAAWRLARAKARRQAAWQEAADEAKAKSGVDNLSGDHGITPPKKRLIEKVSSLNSKIAQTAQSALSAGAKVIRDKKAKLSGLRNKQGSAGVNASAATREEPRPQAPIRNVPKLRIVKSTDNKADHKSSVKTASRVKTVRSRKIGKLFKKDITKPALEQARQAITQTQIKKAESILITHIVKNPKDTNAYMLLGEAALAQGNLEDAISAFQQVIKINPKTRGCHAQLGHATYKAGKYTDAIEALQRAHDADPFDTKVIEELLAITQRMNIIPMQKTLTEELAQLEKQQ